MFAKLSNVTLRGAIKIFGSTTGDGGEEPVPVSAGGSLTATPNTLYIGRAPNYFGSLSTKQPVLGSAVISDDGTFVHWDGNDSPIVGSDISDMSQKWIIDANKVMTDLDAQGFPVSTLDKSVWPNGGIIGGLLADRKHVLACVNTNEKEGNTYLGGVYVLLYDISSGIPSPQYGSYHRFYRVSESHLRPDNLFMVDLTETQTADDHIVLWWYRESRMNAARLPSINEYRSGHLAETNFDSWGLRSFALEYDTDSPVLGMHGSLMPTSASSGLRAFMLPYGEPYYTRLWWLINKSDMLYHADANNTSRNTDLVNLTGTYPDGVLLSDTIMFTPEDDLEWWEIILMIISLGFYNPYSDDGEYVRDLDGMNHRMVNPDSVQIFPFDDAFYDYLGNYNTTGEHDYFWRPTIRQISANFYLVLFTKKFEKEAAGPSGIRATVRGFIFDQSKQQFVQHLQDTYVPFDLVADMGLSEAHRYSAETRNLAVDYHPASGKYYEVRYTSAYESGATRYHWTLAELGLMSFTAPTEIGISARPTGLTLATEAPSVIVDGGAV